MPETLELLARQSGFAETEIRFLNEPAERLTKSGWVAARPSGTEDIYKIYAEAFCGENHLERIVEEAQAMVDGALGMKRRRAIA